MRLEVAFDCRQDRNRTGVRIWFAITLAWSLNVISVFADPPATAESSNVVPSDFEALWGEFDPTAEPLETEVLHRFEQDGVQMSVVRFLVGHFKGQPARVAAVFGYPSDARGSVPGLLQIHGGGQYADYRACLSNGRRGYATLSLAWAGRIHAPEYSVNPDGMRVFWDNARDDPRYRVTTDWGAVDGYHAPGRHPDNHFPSIEPRDYTIDSVESPRNSGWYLAALAARRGLTFLEQQPQVDPDRLGVYGHSMGGKLTVMTATDDRVRAAAPSCGGISDRQNSSQLFRHTLGDDVYLPRVRCPTIFLSPSNDFHGRISDLPAAVEAIDHKDWRVVCSPHHNHQDTAEYEVATVLWMDQHLHRRFRWPRTPATDIDLDTRGHEPRMRVDVDDSMAIESVTVHYTQQGRADEKPADRLDTIHRHWHSCPATRTDDGWTAVMPLARTDHPLWAYANVRYRMKDSVSGAGYYYGIYQTDTFVASSLVQLIDAEQLRDAQIVPTLRPTPIIESFDDGWQSDWFRYRDEPWRWTTNKIHSPIYRADGASRLLLRVRSDRPNRMAVRLDDHAAEIRLRGDGTSETHMLSPSDFLDAAKQPRADFGNLRSLTLAATERLRPGPGKSGSSRVVGGRWDGPPPTLEGLRWTNEDSPHASKDSVRKGYVWTRDHVQIGVRWQPFIGRPQNNIADGRRAVIAEDSSYVQFWAAWSAIEPTEANRDYDKAPSPGLKALDAAVNRCRDLGRKVEFVFFHVPRWASESGEAGGHRPRAGTFAPFVRRVAEHFKGRVDAYQLTHEANMHGMMRGADVDFVIDEILVRGARAIDEVYRSPPDTPVLVSTTGMSPCAGCEPMPGLRGKGGSAIMNFYDRMLGCKELMHHVDALNMNVTDHGDGFGRVDDTITSSWHQWDLLRKKLDVAGYRDKTIRAAESWVVWDAGPNASDVNGDGVKDERDAFEKTVRIMGELLHRGMNTLNLPWSDNSSDWAMGLTKRLDYNGRVSELQPSWVIESSSSGPPIVTRKVALRGPDDRFTVHDGGGEVFTVDNYARPSDPNHVHYYAWRWFSQLAGGSDEVIRHAVAGETGNDIELTVDGKPAETGYRMASWNRDRKRFIVLVVRPSVSPIGRGDVTMQLRIPSQIRSGNRYNNDQSPIDYRGEGFAEGTEFVAEIETKDFDDHSGLDANVRTFTSAPATVLDGMLSVTIPAARNFTKVEFRQP